MVCKCPQLWNELNTKNVIILVCFQKELKVAVATKILNTVIKQLKYQLGTSYFTLKFIVSSTCHMSLFIVRPMLTFSLAFDIQFLGIYGAQLHFLRLVRFFIGYFECEEFSISLPYYFFFCFSGSVFPNCF